MNKSEYNEKDKQGQPEDVAPEVDATIEEAPQVADDLEEEDSEATTVSIQQYEELQQQLEKEKKEYLFLMAEFDNFRKRTLKEKSELLKNAAEGVLKGLLPIVDDFERGLKAIQDSQDADSVKEGMELIYNKLIKYLEKNGVKAIDTHTGADFDTSLHEAISVVPVPDEEQKGKILDTVEKGYTLNDKVLRHAKVVVGQ